MEKLMFDRSHLVGYNNYKSLIWALYLNIDFRHLPPSSMDVGEFIMKPTANLSPSQEERIDASH